MIPERLETKLKLWQKLALIVFFTFIFQSTITPYLTIGGIQPDFILILVVFLGFIYGSSIGGIGGFVGGLLQDIILSQALGVNAIIKIVLGYLSGFFQKKVYIEHYLYVIMGIFIATILSHFLSNILNFLIGIRLPFWSVFWKLVVPAAFYNSLLSLFLIPVYYKYFKESEDLSIINS